jgi:hypothetical protein
MQALPQTVQLVLSAVVGTKKVARRSYNKIGLVRNTASAGRLAYNQFALRYIEEDGH